jgi:hypothetical protein
VVRIHLHIQTGAADGPRDDTCFDIDRGNNVARAPEIVGDGAGCRQLADRTGDMGSALCQQHKRADGAKLRAELARYTGCRREAASDEHTRLMPGEIDHHLLIGLDSAVVQGHALLCIDAGHAYGAEAVDTVDRLCEEWL